MKRLLYVFCVLLAFPGMAQKSDYNILDYGAVPDGKTLNTAAIQKAIDNCSENGGGTVFVPAGRFVSGTVRMRSNVNFHLSSGAVLEGSKNLEDYPVVIPGIRSYTDNYTCRSLIYGENLVNISIAGQGRIDGNGSYFIVPAEVKKANLFESYKQRPYLIRLINCDDIDVIGITLLNSPMWVQHYLLCRNLKIDGITVNSRVNMNNDGIDIDACENVMISNCNISSGDDAIVLKTSLDRPCRNVTVTNCILSSMCNAFKLGTESNGNFQNISFSNSNIYNTRLAGIALEMVDGGTQNNVSVSGVNMDSVGCAIFIRLADRARPFLEANPKSYTDRTAAPVDRQKPGMGKMFNIMISDVQATNTGKTGCSITGLKSFPVRDVFLSNINIEFAGGGTADLADRKIEELPDKYPEYSMFGLLPAYGFYCRHVAGLTLDNVFLSYKTPDYRPALFLDDVNDSAILNLRSFSEKETREAVVIRNSQNVKVEKR